MRAGEASNHDDMYSSHAAKGLYIRITLSLVYWLGSSERHTVQKKYTSSTKPHFRCRISKRPRSKFSENWLLVEKVIAECKVF